MRALLHRPLSAGLVYGVPWRPPHPLPLAPRPAPPPPEPPRVSQAIRVALSRYGSVVDVTRVDRHGDDEFVRAVIWQRSFSESELPFSFVYEPTGVRFEDKGQGA